MGLLENILEHLDEQSEQKRKELEAITGKTGFYTKVSHFQKPSRVELRKRFGWAGDGRYNELCNLTGENRGFVLTQHTKAWLAQQLDMTNDELMDLLQFLSSKEYGLLQSAAKGNIAETLELIERLNS